MRFSDVSTKVTRCRSSYTNQPQHYGLHPFLFRQPNNQFAASIYFNHTEKDTSQTTPMPLFINKTETGRGRQPPPRIALTRERGSNPGLLAESELH
jgi:hypothetical protein